MSRFSRPTALWALLGVIALTVSGCLGAASRPPTPTPSPSKITKDKLILIPKSPDTHILPPAPLRAQPPTLAVVLFVDGLDWTSFAEALRSEAMPNVSELMASHPSWYGEARASFPTSTAPNVPEMITGLWSDSLHGMPDNIHALNRNQERLVRFEVEGEAWDGTSMTLFDYLKAEGGETLSYFEGSFDGADLTIHREVSYLMDLLRLKTQEEAVLAYDNRMIEDLKRRIASAGRLPNLIFLRLGGVDAAGHFYGPNGQPYRSSISALDRHIGEIITILNDTKLDDGRSAFDLAHIVLISDHGMENTPNYVNLDLVLKNAGLKPFPTSTPIDIVKSEVLPDTMKDFDAIAVPDGSNLAAIYLRARGPGGLLSWSKQPPAGQARNITTDGTVAVDLVARLLEKEGVLRVLERLPKGESAAHGREGVMVIRLRYTPEGALRMGAFIEGRDPFGECGEGEAPCCKVGQEKVDRCYLTEAQWRDATLKWERPELPRMLTKAFGSSPEVRPDLLIEGADGFGFMEQSMGNHGRYERALLEIPFLVSGPRVNPEASPKDPRVVDLMPTLMTLFGLTPKGGSSVDGDDLGLFKASTAP